MLSKMHDTYRIRFIDIEDDLDRNEIIKGYLKGECLSKNEYKKTMEGHDMSESFAKQISLSAHTWTDLILADYLEKIPNVITAKSKGIQETKVKIEQNTEEIKQEKKSIKDAEDKIISENNKIEKVKNNQL
jgi:hypothetical protein